MKKWAMIVDVAECENCNNCFLSCKDEHVGNDFPGYAAPQPLHGHRWINLYRKERGQVPMVDHVSMPAMCNHCDAAPCIEASRDGAVYKRPDGIVIIDPDKARGQRQLVDACPYGAIWWNEELELPQKWIFDAHLLDAGWKEPRCVQSCPTGALKSLKVDDEELAQRIEAEALEVLSPGHGTKPRVFYRNLHLFTKCFIGGTVVTRRDGVEDCLKDVLVILSREGEELARARTDAFGEFRFDRLDPDSGAYELRFEAPEAGGRTLDVTLGDSTYLGVIELASSPPDEAGSPASRQAASTNPAEEIADVQSELHPDTTI